MDLLPFIWSEAPESRTQRPREDVKTKATGLSEWETTVYDDG